MRDGSKKRLKLIIQIAALLLVMALIVGAFVFTSWGRNIPVLQPQGTIAEQQMGLIVFTVCLGLLVIVPVFILLFTMAWRYREGNTKAKYQPDMKDKRGLELIWWGIPCMIILVLAFVAYFSSHSLDPFKKLDSSVQPVKIQVIALEWKWLFLYPDQGVATVNYANIPEDTPIDLTITSDAPMNSFWVPALAGQIYAMSGMSSELHIMADSVGTYYGSSANISGEGFAGMKFAINAMTGDDYKAWVNQASYAPKLLTADSYKDLAAPSKNNPETTYMLMDIGLYDEVIMKYMSPGANK